jgi:pimeloyl-ACP methyl ester carboxylesterase
MPSLPLGDQREHSPNAAFVESLLDDAQQMAPAAFTEVARALSAWNRFADARRITLPTLLVWGDRDVIVDRDAMTRTLIAIPGAANLEVIQGVGHCPMIEAPTALVSRFLDFITQDFDTYAAVRGSVP